MVNGTPSIEELLKLWSLCFKFIHKHDIYHPEKIYTNDRVIEDSYGLMHDMCKIVGFTDYEDDDEDEE